jgi:hypothetical protein
MRIVLLTFALASLLPLASCVQMPKPTPQEIAARDKWAAVVSPAARERIMDDAAHHTAWSEKRKIRYEIDQLQHVYKQEQSRKSRAATRAATRPATRAATRPSGGGGA